MERRKDWFLRNAMMRHRINRREGMWIKQEKLFWLPAPIGFRFVYVDGKGNALFTHQRILWGRAILPLRGAIADVSKGDTISPEAVQIGTTTFLDTKKFVPEDFINHSCAPNAFVDLKARAFTALRDILPGEEITFDYCTTEYDLIQYGTDFMCKCGSARCRGRIQGFRYLSSKDRQRLKHMLLPYLRT